MSRFLDDQFSDETRAEIVLALARGANRAALARRYGVSERTLRRRATETQMAADIRQAQQQLLTDATAKLSGGCTQAVLTLRRLLKTGSAAIQLKSACAILDAVVRLNATVDLSNRVGELESRLQENADGQPAGEW